MKILALNLCTSWTSSRSSRLQIVADFVKANEIDVLLVQEGVRSCLVYNTIRKLANMLGYDHFSRSNVGYPFFFEFQVGVISRFKIDWTASLNCAVPQNNWLDAIPLPWRKRAVAATVSVPGLGMVTCISVHLVSAPKTPADKANELAMVDSWKAGLSARDVTVFGGDFNYSFNSSPSGMEYGGLSPDYIFVEGAKIIDWETVLTGQVVTDHACGVLVEIGR